MSECYVCKKSVVPSFVTRIGWLFLALAAVVFFWTYLAEPLGALILGTHHPFGGS